MLKLVAGATSLMRNTISIRRWPREMVEADLRLNNGQVRCAVPGALDQYSPWFCVC